MPTFVAAALTTTSFLCSSSTAGDNVRAPTGRIIESGDVVNIEISPSVDGQFVQLCRTVVLGSASAQRRNDYELIIAALREGMNAASPGATVAEVVSALDSPLFQAGLGEYCRPPHIRVRGTGQGLASLSPGDITFDNQTVLLERNDVHLAPQSALSGERLHDVWRADRGTTRRRSGADGTPAAARRMLTMQPVILRGRTGLAFGPQEFAERVAALQQELAARDLDAAVAFGDARNYAPLTWVTGLVPMLKWAVVVTPAVGETELYLAMPGVRDLPRMNKLAVAGSIAPIGALPAALARFDCVALAGAHAMRAASESMIRQATATVDGDSLFAQLMAVPSEREREVLRLAAASAKASATATMDAWARGETATEALLCGDLSARRAGMHDVRVLFEPGRWSDVATADTRRDRASPPVGPLHRRGDRGLLGRGASLYGRRGCLTRPRADGARSGCRWRSWAPRA